MIDWPRISGAVPIGIALALAGCSAAVLPASEAPGDLPLPGPMELLPPDAEHATATPWMEATGELPAGIDPGARYATDLEAMSSLTTAFGDRPMPPGAPGITSEVPTAGPGSTLVLVTLPTFDEPNEWGAQYALVLREATDGWRLETTFGRRLCLGITERGPCSGES